MRPVEPVMPSSALGMPLASPRICPVAAGMRPAASGMHSAVPRMHLAAPGMP